MVINVNVWYSIEGSRTAGFASTCPLEIMQETNYYYSFLQCCHAQTGSDWVQWIIFLRLLLDKKYALPFRVLDALVGHFLFFRSGTKVCSPWRSTTRPTRPRNIGMLCWSCSNCRHPPDFCRDPSGAAELGPVIWNPPCLSKNISTCFFLNKLFGFLKSKMS